jgi:HlyD family secretion protein
MKAFTPITSPEPPAPRSEHVRKLGRERMLGAVMILVFGGSVAAWSATATLQGAVAAGGHFVVANEVKKIQHPTGGVVAALPVREGQHVAAGDVVLRLDETLARANSQIVARQLDEFMAKAARLATERDGLDAIALPQELESRAGDPDIARIVASETRSFTARRAAREGQKAQLRKRIGQLTDEIRGLSAQQASKERESKIIAKSSSASKSSIAATSFSSPA